MIVEIRRYTIEPGRRNEFVEWFAAEVVPAMEAAGMEIIGRYVSVEDPDVFFYLRAFADEAERDRQYAAFYESEAWLRGMKEKALAMETGYEVEVVRPV